MNPLHAALAAQTSAMRLSADRIRCSGSEGPVEAAILLHEAERSEARTLSAMGPQDDITRLRSLVERCGLLIEARNPSVVLHHRWPDVLSQAERCSGEVAQAALVRLRPSVERMTRDRQELLDRMKRLQQPVSVIVAGTAAQRVSFVRALRTYLEVFPGDWGAWQLTASLEHQLSAHATSWQSISTARRMEPSAGTALALDIAVDALSERDLRGLLDETLARWTEDSDDELASSVANACIALAQRTTEGREELLMRATFAIDRGLARVGRNDRLQRSLRALRLVVGMLQQGKSPDPSVFERAGLPELAARTLDSDPITALRRETETLPRGLAA